MSEEGQMRIAVVCSSNQNRSMEAHNFLAKKGFNVRSFGSGTHVKLPGSSASNPNIYTWSTTYDTMYQDLLSKDRNLYTTNGLLHMLDRNRRIKTRPERFQDCADQFELIVCCEERVYDAVIEHLEGREDKEGHPPVHILNLDIQDNHEEATIGAFMICDLCQLLAQSDDLDNDIDELLQEYEARCQRNILHSLCFY